MAKLTASFSEPDPTLAAVRLAIAHEVNSQPQRRYIGASGIGSECSRKIWYQINGFDPAPISPDVCAAINDGHRTEDLMAARLRMVPGIELWTHKPDGTQYGFDWGFMKGHIDGVILGLLQAPETPHIWENKCVEPALFRKLVKLIDELGEKQALREWDGEYYAQAVTYMEAFDLKRHYMTVTTPGGREMVSLRTEANPKFAKALMNKAKRILASTEPPEKVGKPTYFYCLNFCRHYETCHGKKPNE